MRWIVAGAGPAGALAATLLARAGEVTLIEQRRFPRDKVCGECLSALGWDVLGRAGLHGRLRRAGATPLRRVALHDRDGACVVLDLPRPMWGLSRAAMDVALRDASADAGARVLQPARCDRIEPGRPARVVARMLADNVERRLDADAVLVADGRSALLGGRPAPTGDFGVKAHLRDVDGPEDAIELFALDGCYVGLAPIEGGRWNLAGSVPAAWLERGAEAALQAMVASNAALRRRLRRARRDGEALTCALPRFAVRPDWPPGVVPVGNAAGAIEPIGGEGMGLALRSAELAAGALLAAEGGAIDTRALRAAYRALWDGRGRACRLLARLLSSPAAAGAALALVEASPRLGAIALRCAGK